MTTDARVRINRVIRTLHTLNYNIRFFAGIRPADWKGYKK